MNDGDDLSLPEGVAPSPQRVEHMAEAERVALEVLDGLEAEASVSPLGPGWSSDLDLFLADVDEGRRRAERAGWIPLSALLRHLGHEDAAAFAIVKEGVVLARADLKEGVARSPMLKAVGRVRRLGGADPRAVLEFRHLYEQGLDFSVVDTEVLERVADLETQLGGRRLAAWCSESPPERSPVASRGAPRVRRPQVRVGVSGIDGAGKSTLISALADTLERLEIPSEVVWTRPGMGLKRLDKLARKVRGEQRTGLRRLAEGQEAGAIRSRRGLIGWVWLTAVTVAFLMDAHAQTRKAGGVVIFDRHLLDALGTIEVMYQGVDPRLQQRLIRRLLPRADTTVWLDVDPELAAQRKPDDLIGAGLVMQQHAAYHRFAPSVPRLQRRQETQDPYLTAAELLRGLNESLTTTVPTFRARLFMAVRRWRS